MREETVEERERGSLSGALPGVGGDSEGEEEDVEDENNFSVYECPGLAPTGDIEVRLSPSPTLSLIPLFSLRFTTRTSPLTKPEYQ